MIYSRSTEYDDWLKISADRLPSYLLYNNYRITCLTSENHSIEYVTTEDDVKTRFGAPG